MMVSVKYDKVNQRDVMTSFEAIKIVQRKTTCGDQNAQYTEEQPMTFDEVYDAVSRLQRIMNVRLTERYEWSDDEGIEEYAVNVGSAWLIRITKGDDYVSYIFRRKTNGILPKTIIAYVTIFDDGRVDIFTEHKIYQSFQRRWNNANRK